MMAKQRHRITNDKKRTFDLAQQNTSYGGEKMGCAERIHEMVVKANKKCVIQEDWALELWYRAIQLKARPLDCWSIGVVFDVSKTAQNTHSTPCVRVLPCLAPFPFFLPSNLTRHTNHHIQQQGRLEQAAVKGLGRAMLEIMFAPAMNALISVLHHC